MSTFDRLDAQAGAGVDAVLNTLADELLKAGRYHELWEARKLQNRRKLGLSLFPPEQEDLSESQRTALEDGLVAACKEVGVALWKQGQLRDGWMYLRPVGDKNLARELLAKIEVDEDNMDQFVDVALHEGVDPVRGFAAVLKNYGTCNAITTFESALQSFPRADRQAAAAMLVERLHHELSENLRSDISRQEGSEPKEKSIRELVADRDWLFGETNYHIDTTHLAAGVRAARLLEDPKHLRLALDLTEYGRQLHRQYQYQGDEPFVDTYPAHAFYFQAVLGENEAAALDFFAKKAKEVEVAEHGTLPIETYAELLARRNRPGEAMAAILELVPAGTRMQGVAPPLVDLARRAGDFSAYLRHARERDDLLSYAAGLVQKITK